MIYKEQFESHSAIFSQSDLLLDAHLLGLPVKWFLNLYAKRLNVVIVSQGQPSRRSALANARNSLIKFHPNQPTDTIFCVFNIIFSMLSADFHADFLSTVG